MAAWGHVFRPSRRAWRHRYSGSARMMRRPAEDSASRDQLPYTQPGGAHRRGHSSALRFAIARRRRASRIDSHAPNSRSCGDFVFFFSLPRDHSKLACSRFPSNKRCHNRRDCAKRADVGLYASMPAAMNAARTGSAVLPAAGGKPDTIKLTQSWGRLRIRIASSDPGRNRSQRSVERYAVEM